MAINEKAAEFGRWVESPESLPWWAFLGYIVIAVVVFYIAAGFIGDLFIWASKSWKRLLLSPFYLLLIVIVIAALYRVGTLVSVIPMSVQSVLEQAVGQ
jgi:hypothetical protein